MKEATKKPSQLGMISRGVLALKNVQTAPQMFKERERIAYWNLITPRLNDIEKKAVWKLVWHYRGQIADKYVVAHAAKKMGFPMADLMMLVEEIEE